MDAVGTPWRWSTNPAPFVQNIGHQVEIVNGTLDGEFSGDVGGTTGGLFMGVALMAVAYIGYKHAKRKRWI
jgi:hypothetical protein